MYVNKKGGKRKKLRLQPQELILSVRNGTPREKNWYTREAVVCCPSWKVHCGQLCVCVCVCMKKPLFDPETQAKLDECVVCDLQRL